MLEANTMFFAFEGVSPSVYRHLYTLTPYLHIILCRKSGKRVMHRRSQDALPPFFQRSEMIRLIWFHGKSDGWNLKSSCRICCCTVVLCSCYLPLHPPVFIEFCAILLFTGVANLLWQHISPFFAPSAPYLMLVSWRIRRFFDSFLKRIGDPSLDFSNNFWNTQIFVLFFMDSFLLHNSNMTACPSV